MQRKKRAFILLLCGAMLFSLCSPSIYAEEDAPAGSIGIGADGLCVHHPRHDESCGYSEGERGTPCTHRHTEACYISVTKCIHVHDESCYPETDDSISGRDATPADAEKKEPTDCTHVCSEESGCITKKLNCRHTHKAGGGKDDGEGDDEACGYLPATKGTPCSYVCPICDPDQTENILVPTESLPIEQETYLLSAGTTAYTYDKKLYKDDTWSGGIPDPKTELTSGKTETISFKDQLIIQYLFDLSEGALRTIDANSEKGYPLTCPDGLKWNAGDDTDINFKDENDTEIKFATLRRSDGSASLTFEENLLDKAESGIENIHLYLGCRLDQGALEQAGQPETWPIVLSAETTIDVRIAENQARASALAGKKGTYANGVFTWEVTYQPGRKEQDLPLTFVDEFDPTYHDYIEGSLQIVKTDGSVQSATPDTVKKETAGAKTKLTYPIPEDLSKGTDPVTITYQTALTDKGLTVTKDQTVTNSAWLINTSGTRVGDIVSGKATLQKTEWLQKTAVGGLQYGSDGRRYLDWKVTVKTNGRDLGELILHDRLLEDTNNNYATLDEASITVTAYRGSSQINETSLHKIDVYTSDLGYDLTFATRDADQYVITYKTYISEAYFENSQSGQFKNQASLEYGWYPGGDGSGELFKPTPPEVTVPVNVNGNLIGKSGAGYDPSTHQITWRVTVNPHRLDLQKITTTDDLWTVGQTYVDGSFAVEGSASSTPAPTPKTLNWDNSTKTLSAAFENTGTQTFSYTFKTTVDDPKDHGYNLLKKDYKNTVNATAILSHSTGSPLPASATATQSIHSNVLQKKAEGYDYSDHTIGWCITVNENQMPMQSENGVLLEDTLPAGLTYVDGSLTVKKTGAGGQEEAVDADSFTWRTVEIDGVQKLTFDHMGGNSFNDKLLLRFRTKVDVDAIGGFKDAKDLSISNSVVLKRSGYEDLSETAEQKIDNNILDKQGRYNKEQGTIAYTVDLNPHGITLDNITVRDDLPKGLQLDKDTIRLYKAKVGATGGFTKGDQVTLTDILTANVLEGWFEIKLPTGNTAYILEYAADVTDITQTTFHNKISMNGTVSTTPPSGGSDVGVGSGGGGGGGTASPKVNLTLQLKEDLRPGVGLEGAVFRIYDGEEPLNEVTTDKDGKAVFRYLKRGKTYRIEEVTPPKGHTPIDQPIRISISDDKNVTPKEYEYPAILNTPVTGSLSFTKKSDTGRLLEGAAFTLTDKTPGSTFTKTAASNADGGVSFADIPYGTYDLRETKTPAYHEPDDTVYQVVVDETGKATLIDPAYPDMPLTEIGATPTGERWVLTVNKIDSSTRTPLSGASIGLYADENCATLIKQAVSGDDGTVTFEGLLKGQTYWLKEDTAPSGYHPDGTIHLAEETTPFVTIENTKRSVGPDPDPGSGSGNATDPGSGGATIPGSGSGGATDPGSGPGGATDPTGPGTTESAGTTGSTSKSAVSSGPASIVPAAPTPEPPTETIGENPGYPTELPDPNDPNSPDRIAIWENGVPKTYAKVWDPEKGIWAYILEEEVPLSRQGLPKTGDKSRDILWMTLFMGSAVSILWLIAARRKQSA